MRGLRSIGGRLFPCMGYRSRSAAKTILPQVPRQSETRILHKTFYRKMRMEANDYVSYELAVKLKDAGFDEPCDYIHAWMSEPRFSVTETAEL